MAFMGATYYLLPLIFRRKVAFWSAARVQPYLFALGMLLLSMGMTFAGSFGVPRRHWDISFSQSPFDVQFNPAVDLVLAVMGIGGIMRALRTIPVLAGIARDMEELCPGALMLNYTNPMAMNCWALSRLSPVRVVGLCHSVQGTARQLADDLGLPLDDIEHRCAGINHMAFYLELRRRSTGEDLYPALRRLADEGRVPDWNRVRYEMLRRLGHFVTESSEHFSEYCPHFIRRDRPDLIERFHIPLDEYLRRCEAITAEWERMRDEFESDAPLTVERSMEYGSLIIHSLVTGERRTVHGNVPNRSLISNLPGGCCVEVPCVVDGGGLWPEAAGALPPQLAAIIMTNVNVQSLAVEAAVTGRRDHVHQAAMLDPHTAAELTLDQIEAMVEELLTAHGAMIPPLT
ncbi:MAG: cbb3-type cytochrome c oxidase subunit I [Candidatus Sumerlaeia bacterium]|nr:cbb3-type cytochrome c oxidase subunit I [Candidatus Sumerlaeia bacterium]